MGLFKSAEEKRWEEKSLVRKALNHIRTYINKLEEAKKRYIEEAKRAKQQGIDSQYKLARSGLAMAVRQQQVAEQLLLNIELNQQTKDASEVTRDFVQGIDTLGKQITTLNGKINITRAKKNMRSAMAQSEQMQDNLEGFMDESEMMFGSVASGTGLESELDALIDREVGADNADVSALDAEIDKLLRKANNT